MAWTDLTFSYGAVLTSAQMSQLDANFDALAAGDSGAPNVQTAGIADNAVTAAKIAANAVGSSEITADAVGASEISAGAVGQSEAATSSIGQGELISTTGIVSTSSTVQSLFTLPGGEYGFYPQIRYVGAVQGNALIGSAGSSSYVTNIDLWVTVSGTVYAQQRYIQASPPYDLGDGVAPLFIFVEID